METKSVYGPQRVIKSERCRKASELDLIVRNSAKETFERESELLYGGEKGFHRACSLPKGIAISQRSKYLRNLFRIPRGFPASIFPQAYISNKNLGTRKKSK